MSEVQDHVDVLVFSGTFYAQTQPRIVQMLTAAAQAGVRVRLCFGDPGAEAVAVRDREEDIGGTLAAKIRSALTYYRPCPTWTDAKCACTGRRFMRRCSATTTRFW